MSAEYYVGLAAGRQMQEQLESPEEEATEPIVAARGTTPASRISEDVEVIMINSSP